MKLGDIPPGACLIDWDQHYNQTQLRALKVICLTYPGSTPVALVFDERHEGLLLTRPYMLDWSFDCIDTLCDVFGATVWVQEKVDA